jgi:MFS family permease
MKSITPLLLVTAATPAFASGGDAAIAALALFVSLVVGAAGGALAGWFGWRKNHVYLAEIVAVVVLSVLFLLLMRPQDLRDGFVGMLFTTAFVSLFPLALCHFPAYAIASGLSPRKTRDADNRTKP